MYAIARFLEYWLRWPSVENFLAANRWAWPLSETLHFVGLILLVGIVSIFDLRLLGVAKRMPLAPLRKLLPWAVFGLVLCVASGLVFVTGLMNNVDLHPWVALQIDRYLQVKLIFVGLAGLNLLAFHQSGISRACDDLGPGDDAPPAAKAIAGFSFFLWIGVVYWGRMVPWGI
ncbi:MAG: hypothetical protein CL477_18995 [Acidobacteria bacterium]|mgnify:CR=1 FL=1|jgi:hypothetical protein|nr:hypothetical protein [Acidobacteriota bacterium]HJN46389.1 hypothetical protein [Vicinamibacterales bacterium]